MKKYCISEDWKEIDVCTGCENPQSCDYTNNGGTWDNCPSGKLRLTEGNELIAELQKEKEELEKKLDWYKKRCNELWDKIRYLEREDK